MSEQSLNNNINSYSEAAREQVYAEAEKNWVTQPVPKEVSLIPNFGYIFKATALFALIYTFCLYRNPNSIMSPICAICGGVYFYMCAKKLGGKISKSLLVEAGCMFLFGLNLFFINDQFLINLDKLGIWFCICCGLASIFCAEKNFQPIEYLFLILKAGFVAIVEGFGIFGDLRAYVKKYGSERRKKVGNAGIEIIKGLVIGVPIMLFVLLLLASADQIFCTIIDNAFAWLFNFLKEDIFFAPFMFVVSLEVLYGLNKSFYNAEVVGDEIENKKSNPIAAITMNILIGIIYLMFSIIQVVYIFVGNIVYLINGGDYREIITSSIKNLPANFSYTEYARSGFFQLVFVCALNIIIVLICMYKCKESKLLKVSLLLITACTFIMMISSALRMVLYVSAFGMTFLRLYVFYALIVIFFELIGVTVYILRDSFPLMKYMITVALFCVLIYVFSNPSRIIAKTNLSERFCVNQDYSNIDFGYLYRELSMDAAKEVDKAIQRENNPEFTEKVAAYFSKEAGNNSFRHFNVCRAEYNRIAEKYKGYIN